MNAGQKDKGGRDTIYALSSGSPPAAIALIRLSGPRASDALVALGGRLPAPRQATLAALRHPRTGELLDTGLVLNFPAPASATGTAAIATAADTGCPPNV